jgi:DDE superfamily endonuclease
VAYWLNAQPDDPAVFVAQVAAVCAVYQQAPAFEQQGGHVISTDEKTGIQALERAALTLPMKPGLVERPEYEYIRHGTLCLIANFNVATGEVVAPTLGPSRTEEDFAAHIAQTITTDPEALGSLSSITSTRINLPPWCTWLLARVALRKTWARRRNEGC